MPAGKHKNKPRSRGPANYLGLLPRDAKRDDKVHVRLVPEQVDYGLLKGWVSTYKRLHDRCNLLRFVHIAPGYFLIAKGAP